MATSIKTRKRFFSRPSRVRLDCMITAILGYIPGTFPIIHHTKIHLHVTLSYLCVMLFSSTCSWPVKSPEDEVEGWRFFRIRITGPDASGKYFYICISGMELYGMLTGVASKPKSKRNT